MNWWMLQGRKNSLAQERFFLYSSHLPTTYPRIIDELNNADRSSNYVLGFVPIIHWKILLQNLEKYAPIRYTAQKVN